MSQVSYKDWLKEAIHKCKLNDTQDSKLKEGFEVKKYAEPLILLEFVTKKSKASIRAHDECLLSHAERMLLDSYLERFLKHEPLAYILGSKEFYGRDFIVSSSTLIPRPETELLIDIVVALYKDEKKEIKLCDIGTGSGCIAITLMAALQNARCLAYDISAKAIEIAKKNAKVHNVEQRIEFILQDIALANTQELFDCVISNPPYIPDHEYQELETHVKDFEPQVALTSGETGLEVIENVVEFASKSLKKSGVLLIEHGYNQAKAVQQIVQKFKVFKEVESIKDYAGHWRICKAVKL